MQAVRLARGESIDYTPGSAVAAGAVVILNSNLVAVAETDIAANRLGALAVRGLFTMEKDSSNITAIGTKVYWDEDGTVVGGAATGAITTTAASNIFAGWAVQVAGVGASTVQVVLCSTEDAASLALSNLTDVSLATATSGNLLVANGATWASCVVSGDVTLATGGAFTLNDAHAEQLVLVPLTGLGADADQAATIMFASPRAGSLVSVGYLPAGTDFGTVSDASTSVFAVTDVGGNAIVTKTYNTATQPTAAVINDFGALNGTHKVLTAGEAVKVAVTNGSTAKTPAGYIVLRFIPTNA